VPAVDRRTSREAEDAEDRDADVGAGDELVVEDDPGTPPVPARRLGARSTSRSGMGGASSSPARPGAGAGDPDRTQPMVGLPDADREDPERP
jgi:hypothetical protein